MLSMCGSRSIAGYDKEAIWCKHERYCGRYGYQRKGGLHGTLQVVWSLCSIGQQKSRCKTHLIAHPVTSEGSEVR
jgi:hypothetical protein